MRDIVNRIGRQAGVVALLIGLDLCVSLPIMGATYRPFSWMSIAPADEKTLYPVLPRIQLSAALVKATALEGRIPPNAAFSVRNAGGGAMPWRASSDSAWLTIVPIKGTSTGEWDTVTLVFNSAALPYGLHTATVTVTAASSPDGPRTVAVALRQQPGSIPGRPALLRPAANEKVPFTNRLEFVWKRAPRAQRYTVFVGRAGTMFTNVTVAGETATNWVAQAPFRAGLYTWMVMGRNGIGPGPWSRTASFRVLERRMEPDAWVRLPGEEPPAFGWEDTPGASGYQVSLEVHDAPLSPRADDARSYRLLFQGEAARGEDNLWTPAGVTFGPATYRWRVREKQGSAWAPWSTYAYFRIDAPRPPDPLTPSREAVTGGRPLFSWEAPDAAPESFVELRVRKAGRIVKVYSGLSGTAFTLPPGVRLPSGQLEWQVRAFESGGSDPRFSPWSAAVPFTVR